MLNFAQIEQKRIKHKISKYKLCKESTVSYTTYHRNLKKKTTKQQLSGTLEKLGRGLEVLIERNNGHSKAR